MLKRLALAVACSSLALTGCSATRSAHRASVDYNRAFADARTEILLLNILRTAAREPMLFSGISSVTGGSRSGAQVSIPFENIILGGVEAINPSLGLSARNPSITIVPLEGREFRQGMARPIQLELIDYLMAQGWNRTALLSLAIGGVVCSADGRTTRLNAGHDPETTDAFLRVFERSHGFSVVAEQRTVLATVTVSGDQLLRLLREGVGSGRGLGAIRQSDAQRAAGTYAVEIVEQPVAVAHGLDFTPVCGSQVPHGRGGTEVRSRSPQSMIGYLAEVHRRQMPAELTHCAQPTAHAGEDRTILFRIRVVCPGAEAPASAVAVTRFRGHTYYIPSAEEAGGGDMTLRIITLVTELIALQTTEASLGAARPLLTIPQ